MAYTAGVGNAGPRFLCIVHWLQFEIVTPPTVTVVVTVSSGVGTAAIARSTAVKAMHAGERTVSR